MFTAMVVVFFLLHRHFMLAGKAGKEKQTIMNNMTHVTNKYNAYLRIFFVLALRKRNQSHRLARKKIQ